MSNGESLYLLVYETKPSPEMPNPNGYLGAVVNCFLHTDSWENAEQIAQATVQQEGWEIAFEVNRGMVERSNMQEEGLPYFDHALQNGVALQVNAWDEEDPADPELNPEEAAPEQRSPLEQMVRFADQVVANGTESGYAFDFSELSLRALDEFIPTFHPNGATLDTTYLLYAGYVGEVVRRNVGAEWRCTDENGFYLEGSNFSAGPVKWVYDKFQNPAEESLAEKYHAFKQLIHAGPPGLSSTPPPIPEGTPVSSPPQEEDKSLYQAPLVVFMMVAAADGNIDAKEAKKFKEIIAKIDHHPNGLFKAAVSAMQSNFEQNVKELVEAGPLGMMAFLLRAREMATAVSPEMAPGYLQALYDLGEKVAKSSGGILGFGGMGKDEKNTLELIGKTLGVK